MKLVQVHDLHECLCCHYACRETSHIDDLERGRVSCKLIVCGNQKNNGVPIPILSPAQEYFNLPPFPGQFEDDCS